MNKLESANYGIETKTWAAGLARYQQSNCQCTLTDDGYRIYRTPNITYSSSDSSTRTMWGGLVLKPFSADANAFEKGHTYILMFDVKGVSSKAASDVYWTFNVGNAPSSPQLTPTASTVETKNPVVANFNSDEWQLYYYKWTINDDVYKVAHASTPSGFVSGNTYPSYRDFKFGYGYQSTGENGTDIYIKNVRLYDITNIANMDIKKTGTAEYISMVETSGQGITSIAKFGEIRADGFIEI